MEEIGRSFGSATIPEGSYGVLTVTPPTTAYFLPHRVRIAAIDLRRPSASSDLKITSVTVGGSPQIGINILHPHYDSPGVRLRDIDGSRVNWSMFSRAGLARELQVHLFNPDPNPVHAFICIEGFCVQVSEYVDSDCSEEVSAKHEEPEPETAGIADDEDLPQDFISSEATLLRPGEQRVLKAIPTFAPYFAPSKVRYSVRSEDGDAVPFCVVEAFCSNTLLYNATCLHDLFQNHQHTPPVNASPSTRELLRMLSEKIGEVEKYGWDGARAIEGKARAASHAEPVLKGTLSTLLVEKDGYGNASHWPTVSTSGLGGELGVVAFNPWPFNIRADFLVKGRPLSERDSPRSGEPCSEEANA